MTFLHPILAAAAIAGVSIPILIHLLMRRRRKPVMWGAMRFLLEAYRQNRRRLRLEQILLLTARCLLILLAGLAIARPLMGKAGMLGGRGAVTLYILIDNGLAGSAQSDSGQAALERHKAQATALLGQLDSAGGDRAAVIALGGPAQGLVVPPSTGIAALRDVVAGLTATESVTDLSGALEIVGSSLEAESRATKPGRTVVAVLSDFLAGSADTQRKLAQFGAGNDGLALLASRPAESGTANTTILNVEPLRPVVIAPRRGTAAVPQPTPVRIALRRSGPRIGEAAATTVRFSLQADATQSGGAPVGEAVVRWAPGQTDAAATASVDVGAAARATTSGAVVLAAAIDADAIPGDNVARRPIEVRQSLRVGLVAPRRTGLVRPGIGQYEPADWFRLALQPTDPAAPGSEPEIEISDIEPAALDAARLAGLDAVIVVRPDSLAEGAWRRLRAFADAGGLILVAPPAQATVHLWPDAMTRDLGLPWTVAREARATKDGASIAADRATRQGLGSRDLLGLLEAELPDLAGAIRILKALPVEVAAGETSGQSSTLLALKDGSPLLLVAVPGTRTGAEPTPEASPTGRGLVALLTVAPSIEWTDLQTKPLMVPLVQELIRQGVGRARGAFADIAGSLPEVPIGTVELRPAAGSGDSVIRASGGRAADPIRRAGLWRALDDRGAARAVIAINADPAGGRGEAQPASAIGTWLSAAVGGVEPQWLGGATPELGGGSASEALKSALERGDDSSRWVFTLLIAALVLALAELVLARIFSHATVADGGAEGAPA